MIAPLTIGIALTVVMLLGVLAAWLFVGRREVPVTAPVRVSPVDAGRPPRRSTPTRSTSRCSCAPASG